MTVANTGQDRRSEGGAWGVALLGVIVSSAVLFTGHGMPALYILIGSLCVACWIYYK